MIKKLEKLDSDTNIYVANPDAKSGFSDILDVKKGYLGLVIHIY